MKPRQQRTKTAPPEPELLPAVIESLLFVASEPQDVSTLSKSLNVSKKQIEQALDHLTDTRNGRGVFVQRIGDRVQLATVPDAAPYIEQFLEVEYGQLSRAALESLAIIAYRSPVTRAVVEQVRGVNSDHAVATLLTRGLIEEVGRAPGPGRPVMFAPAVRFLEYFGLQRADELPPLPEVEELVAAPTEAAQHAAEALAEHDEPLADSEAQHATDASKEHESQHTAHATSDLTVEDEAEPAPVPTE